jgi:hypothetical protein
MPEIDPNDESLDRWVVQRYRYDPARRERRNVDEAAFDNEAEFLTYIEEAAQLLAEQKSAGLAESVEHYSGRHLDPGHRERMQRSRRNGRS